MTEVTTFYLEMNSPSALSEKRDAKGLLVEEAQIKQFHYNRFLYRLVGEAWEWSDRLSWSDERWHDFVEGDAVRTWVAYFRGAPAGFYELEKQEGGDVEIAYFGLAPRFIGKGFGGYLLSRAVRCAWEWEGTRRVWLHTCTRDHPSALRNYQARGFEIYRTEVAGGEPG